jgi:hypothetical protein
MSLFKPQFDNFSTQRFNLGAGEWEIEIASLKLRSVEIKKGDRAGQKMHMITVNSRVISDSNGDTTNANKPFSFDLIINPDEPTGFNNVLKLAMACVGIRSGTAEADAEFTERFGNDDWSVDTDTGTLGSAWHALAKSRVIAVTKNGGNIEYPRTDLSYARPI